MSENNSVYQMEDNIEGEIIGEGSPHEVTTIPAVRVRLSSLTRRNTGPNRLIPREQTPKTS
jgi:hypothetical protein